MISLKRTARISGLLYLVVAITGFYSILYVPSHVLGTTPSAEAILNQEFLFRTGIMANFICQTVFIFLALQLYKLFEGVSKQLSMTLLVLVTVSVPLSFVVIFNQLHAVSLLNEEFILNANPTQIQISTLSFLKIFDYGNLVMGIFWGLWLIPFGMLAIQSGYMPKLFGYFLIAGGLSYIIDACAFILQPSLHQYTTILVSVCGAVAELSVLFWLLIKGVKTGNEHRKVTIDSN